MDENNEEIGASEEVTPNEEPTSEEKSEEPEEKKADDGEKVNKSAIAQKKYWRGKYNSLKEEYEGLLSRKTEEIRTQEDLPSDEAERKAQEYIDKRIELMMKKRQEMAEISKKQKMSEFESELADVLEDNPTLNEKDVADLCKETDITPKLAAKILLREVHKTKKPVVPNPKSASSQVKIKGEERKTGGNFWAVTDKLLKKYTAE